MALLRTGWQQAALAVLMIGLLAYPFLVPTPWIRFATVSGITVIAVLGLQVLVGFAGQVSVGQSAFMGVGAYFAAIAASKWQLPFPVPLLAGGIGAAAVGLMFGLPAARIKGFYLALTTLAAQFVFQFSIVRLPETWFGGAAGISVSRPTIFGYSVQSTRDFYLLTLPFVAAAVLAVLGIVKSRTGRALISVRDNDLAAEVTGINVTYYKVVAFGLASLLAGVAGGLLAYENQLAHFEQFTLFESIWFLGMLIVGGIGSVLGAVLGSIGLRLLQELLTLVSPWLAGQFPGARLDIAYPMINVVLGLLIIAFLIFQPRGLAHMYRQAERYVRLWPFPH